MISPMTDHTRRGFLGWLGAAAGGLAIYRDDPVSPTLPQIHPEVAAAVKQMAPPANRYVIKNEGTVPMVVHYERPVRELHLRHDLRAGNYSGVSAPLLPGEELVITAAPMKV